MAYFVFAQRLIDARKKAGLTQSALAELVGLSRQTFVRWEGGETFPDIRDLKTVADALHTSVAYLIGEIDEASPFFECGGEVGSQLGQNSVKPKKASASRIARLESNVYINGKFLEIPLLTIATAASCGAGNGLYGVVPDSAENIFVEAAVFEHIDESRKPFAVPIEGDSMIGAGLEEGANAVINPAEEVMSGDAALVCCDGAWMIKWIVFNPDGSVELRPANPNYSTTKIDSAYATNPAWLQVIGKVVKVVNISKPKRAF